MVLINLGGQIIKRLLRLLFVNRLFLLGSDILELISNAEVLGKIVAEA